MNKTPVFESKEPAQAFVSEALQYLSDCAAAQSAAAEQKAREKYRQGADQPAQQSFQFDEAEALLSANPYELTRSVLFEIKNKKLSKLNVLGDFLLAQSQAVPDVHAKRAIFPFGANASQMKAVQRALKHSLSVIAGPPGTGKTQTVLNLLANILLRGETCAIVSNNNTATDNILEKLQKDPLPLMSVTARLGSRALREAFFAHRPAAAQPMPLLPTLSEGQRRALEKKVQRCYRFQAQVARLNARERALESELHVLQAALDASDTGYKIASRTSDDVDRAGHVLSLMQKQAKSRNGFSRWVFSLMLRFYGVRYRPRSILTAERALEIAQLKAALHELQSERDELKAQIHALSESVERFVADSRAQLSNALSAKLAGVSRPVCTQQTFRSDAAFWQRYVFVTSSSFALASSAPAHQTFDWIIMDEAGQINLPSAAACLSLAKRAVIIGDERQLPMIVSEALPALPAALPTALNAQTQSVLTRLTAESERLNDEVNPNPGALPVPVTLLAEHYRSHPAIIEFCNREFYEDQLIAMRQDSPAPAVQWVKAAASNLKRVGGSWQNLHQAHLSAKVLEAAHEHGLESALTALIVPYRAQANLCQALKVACDTVHKFQGQERDLVVLSSVANTPVPFIEEARLLNVAVSRAKEQLVVIAPDWRDRCGLWADLERYAVMLKSDQSAAAAKKALPILPHITDTQPMPIRDSALTERLSFVQNYPLRHLIPRHLAGDSLTDAALLQLGASLTVPFILCRRIDREVLAAFIENEGPEAELCALILKRLAILVLPLPQEISGKALAQAYQAYIRENKLLQ